MGDNEPKNVFSPMRALSMALGAFPGLFDKHWREKYQAAPPESPARVERRDRGERPNKYRGNKKWWRWPHRIGDREWVRIYKANPLNYLPAPVLHNIYRETLGQRAMEAMAKRWFESPLGEIALKRARARGYSG